MKREQLGLLTWMWLTACGGGGSAARAPAAPVAVADAGVVGNNVDDERAEACWPGQPYDLEVGRCSGMPSSCPADRLVRDNTCWLRSDKHAVVMGDRVQRGPDWSESDDGDEDGHGLGTVVANVDDDLMIQVRWDKGGQGYYRWGDDDSYEVQVVARAAPVVLEERSRVIAGPTCKACPSGLGTVLAVGTGVASIEWDTGRIVELPVGLAGVLPAGGYDYPLAIGARVKRAPAWTHGNDDRGGAGTVVAYERGSSTARVRWDGGKVGDYGWGELAKRELDVVDAPPPVIPVGFRVTPGPTCSVCVSDGVVKRVQSALELEVAWVAGGTAIVAPGAAGVLPLGPTPPALAVGARVVRGPDWLAASNEDRGGPGTVVEVVGPDRVTVYWDVGGRRTYRWGADGAIDLAASKAPLPTLTVGTKVLSMRGCTACKVGVGEVTKVLAKGRVEVTWPDSGGTATVDVGATGVLPRGDAAAEMSAGVTVRRGPDWKWGDQDTDSGGTGIGIVTSFDADNDGWVVVDWVGGDSNSYRWGADDAHDLTIVSP